MIIDIQDRNLRKRTISLVKVHWKNHSIGDTLSKLKCEVCMSHLNLRSYKISMIKFSLKGQEFKTPKPITKIHYKLLKCPKRNFKQYFKRKEYIKKFSCEKSNQPRKIEKFLYASPNPSLSLSPGWSVSSSFVYKFGQIHPFSHTIICPLPLSLSL